MSGAADELPARIVLRGTQGLAIKGALWFGFYAVLYSLFQTAVFVPMAFLMGAQDRPPTIGKRLDAAMVAVVFVASMPLAVVGQVFDDSAAAIAAVLLAFATAAFVSLALAPTGGFKLEIDGSGVTLVDWWRKRTFLWSDYEIELSPMLNGKLGSIGFERELESEGKVGRRAQTWKKREAVFLSDHFGMKKEDLADLMKRYRARSLGIPLDPEPFQSPSWKG